MLKILNFKNIINIILGIFFFILSINYFFDYEFLNEYFYNINSVKLSFILGYIFFLSHILLNFYRWNILLRNSQNIEANYKINFFPFFSMIFINFVFPFKIGDLYRIFSTKFINKKKLISIIVFERILDILIILLILYLGISLFLLRINIDYFIYFFITSLIGLLIFGYIIFISRKISILINLKIYVLSFIEELRINFFFIIKITILSWILELIFFFIVFKEIFSKFLFEELFISHSSSILAIILPSGPGLIGPVDFTINGILSYYGHSPQDISIFIYLFHIFIFIVCVKIFFLFLFIYPLKMIQQKLLKKN